MGIERFTLPLAAGMIVSLAACSSSTDAYSCVSTAERQNGIAISLTDSSTGALGPFYDVQAKAVDGAYTSSVGPLDSLGSAAPDGGWVLRLAPSREGTFTVTVQARGYAPWTVDGVVTHYDLSNACGDMAPQHLAARLRRT